MSLHVILSHGRGSSPNTKKMVYLARAAQALGHSTHRVDDQDSDDPEWRTERLKEHIAATDKDIILVGSSMGGYTSVVAAKDNPAVKGLFLICPALYLPRYEIKEYPLATEKVTIVHGWRDSVVIPEHSIRFAQEKNATLHLLDTDHLMHDKLDTLVDYFNHFLSTFSSPSN